MLLNTHRQSYAKGNYFDLEAKNGMYFPIRLQATLDGLRVTLSSDLAINLGL